MSDIKESFQTRYIRSSMPRIVPSYETNCREEYVFAITAREPASLTIGPPGQIKITNRINSTDGYLGMCPLCFAVSANAERYKYITLTTIGNFAIRLGTADPSVSLFPQPKRVFTHSTFAETTQAKLVGKVFYELHPQLWGQGLMSEAFTEILRFAFEEVGCTVVEVCYLSFL